MSVFAHNTVPEELDFKVSLVHLRLRMISCGYQDLRIIHTWGLLSFSLNHLSLARGMILLAVNTLHRQVVISPRRQLTGEVCLNVNNGSLHLGYRRMRPGGLGISCGLASENNLRFFKSWGPYRVLGGRDIKSGGTCNNLLFHVARRMIHALFSSFTLRFHHQWRRNTYWCQTYSLEPTRFLCRRLIGG